MASSECGKGTQGCRRLVGAGPDDWWEFEETEIKGRSSQLEAEKWIDGSVDSVLRRFPGAPAKRGVCRFRVLALKSAQDRGPHHANLTQPDFFYSTHPRSDSDDMRECPPWTGLRRQYSVPRFIFLSQAHPANHGNRHPQVSSSSLRSNWMLTEFQRIVLLSRVQSSQPYPRLPHDHFVCVSPMRGAMHRSSDVIPPLRILQSRYASGSV